MEKIRKFVIRALIALLLLLHADVTPIVKNCNKSDDEHFCI